MGKLPSIWSILGMFGVILELGALLMICLVNEISLRNHDLYLRGKNCFRELNRVCFPTEWEFSKVQNETCSSSK